MIQVSKWPLAMMLVATLVPATIVGAQGLNDGTQGGGFPGGGPQNGGFQGGGQMGGLRGGPQGPGMGAPRPGQIVSAVTTPLTKLTSVLSLTSAEQTQIQTIQASYRQQLNVVAPRPTPSFGGQSAGSQPARPDAATRAKIKDLSDDYSKQIEAVLTADQVTALTTLVTQLKELADAQISPRLCTQLNLTTDQFAKIAAIESASHDSLKQAVQKAAASGDYDELEQTIQDVHETVRTQVASVLTSSQEAMTETNQQGRGAFQQARGGGGQDSFGGQQGFGGGPGGGGGPQGFQGPGGGGPGGFGQGGGSGPDAAGNGFGPGNNGAPTGPPDQSSTQSPQGNGDAGAF